MRLAYAYGPPSLLACLGLLGSLVACGARPDVPVDGAGAGDEAAGRIEAAALGEPSPEEPAATVAEPAATVAEPAATVAEPAATVADPEPEAATQPGVKPHYVKCDPSRPELPCTPDAPMLVPAPPPTGSGVRGG